MVCTNNKIDSNIVGLSYAEEECLKELPESPVWRGLAVNSYSDFGGEIKTVARTPISQTRQNKKGTITDVDASGGFNVDVTKNNLTRLLQGFFFADVREKFTTESLNDAAIVITNVDGTNDQYEAASGLNGFLAGSIVLAEGFTNATNNGVKVIDTVASGAIDSTTNLVDETPPAGAKVSTIGFQFGSAEAAITVTSNIVALTAGTADFTDMGLIVGEWIFIGGDGAGHSFVNNKGFARISAIEAHKLTFDDVTWTPQAEAATGLTIQIFFGNVLRNESEAELIVRRSYQLERTLGKGATDTQAEYLEGAVPNELTINVPITDKLNADMSFVACDSTYRSGESGDEIKAGDRINDDSGDALNTSSDVYRIKMAINDPLTSTPGAIFAYVTEGSISINNNVSPVKAIGVVGALDVSVGNFVVGGKLTALFTTTEAAQAVRNNADVGVSFIVAAKNAGQIYDIPLLGLGGGRTTVEKDTPITVPLEPAGAENPNGYTLLHVNFPYLPDLAMPN